MTTFKNNAKYAELVLEYLDLANRADSPLSVPLVLKTFQWCFKGGSLAEASAGTRLAPVTSQDAYPHGLTGEILKDWPYGVEAQRLKTLLNNRARQRKRRAMQGTLGTWLMITTRWSPVKGNPYIYSGMRAIYRAFEDLWAWSEAQVEEDEWLTMEKYARELALASCAASHMNVPTAEVLQKEFWKMLRMTRAPGLMKAVLQVKEIMREINGRTVMNQARTMGKKEWEKWEELTFLEDIKKVKLTNLRKSAMRVTFTLGGREVWVGHRVLLYSFGRSRYALGMSDVERLHQLLMSTLSCLVGCVAQSVVGTDDQKRSARLVTEVAEANISRLVGSARMVPLGDEVLVCKGYRRAYTAHLGWLAGKLCRDETEALIEEAETTAPPGVLDIEGYVMDLRRLDAAGSLNAGKVFKICPAPDVSPGAAMIDRIKQIGDCNTFDPNIEVAFTAELKSQILRALVLSGGRRLELRDPRVRPSWWMDYSNGNLRSVASLEIDDYLAWEGSREMPAVSRYDPMHWKDAGIGADTIRESEDIVVPAKKKNMIMRLLLDDTCPMPGSQTMTADHVIKFFTKAEGHKDPARGIFSANLLDRFAQSWMEMGVDKIARHHPSFMISATAETRALRERELTARPTEPGWVALYYSFDISGWSAKMPAEPQRISHKIWGQIYGGHLFSRATQVNEGAHIYMNLDGYTGWYKNTASNLEGFNGKEMTMVLVALLSLSVRVWKRAVVEEGVLPAKYADATVALLFAYIDDGLSRIDLPMQYAEAAFGVYKRCVIETFARCGFTVETSKCFPSHRFAIFLNEVYLAGRHVVHGVRAAMGICAEPTERHTTLIERVTTVSTGCRGAVMAGLGGFSAVLLLAFHVFQHIREWTNERDPNLLAVWSMAPRAWGGLGLPTLLQMTVSGSGSAFEEGVSAMQKYAAISQTARVAYLVLCRTELDERTPAGVMTAPLSSRVERGYMLDSRVAIKVREALQARMERGGVSVYAERLLKYADKVGFDQYAEALVPIGEKEVIQEQMLANALDSHPHSIFSSFARRIEKSMTVSGLIGSRELPGLQKAARIDVAESIGAMRDRLRSR